MQTEEWLQEYRKLRYQTLLKYGGICMVCHTRGDENNPIQCDHIKPKSQFPELSLEPDNMQVMCMDCNYGKGTWDQTDWRFSSKPEPIVGRIVLRWKLEDPYSPEEYESFRRTVTEAGTLLLKVCDPIFRDIYENWLKCLQPKKN